MNNCCIDITQGNILAVDDNVKNLKLLEGMLSGAGYKVRPALSGEMALKACNAEPPDIILLDINMPNMSGYEVCRKLKANDALKNIPVVFISALSDTAEKIEAFNCGGVDYITKPFQFKEVQARIKTHLTMSSMQKALERMNIDLEDLVKERTHELYLRKEELELEIDRRMKSEEKYTSIFNATNELVIIYDPYTKAIVDANEAALELTGYSYEEIRNFSAGELSIDEPPYTQKQFLKYFEQAVEGEIRLFEWVSKMKTGGKFCLEVSLKKAVIGEQKIVIMVARDISERKRAEEEKKNLEKQVRESQKMEAIGTLAGGIAHDFNNILSAIIGYSDLAIGIIPEEDELYFHLSQINQAGFRAKDLVKQILLFSRQQESEKRPSKIGGLVQEVTRLLEASIPSYIEILTDIAVTSDIVFADPVQIHQVLMNLCTNAAHAIGETEGIIRVTLSEEYIDSGKTGALQNVKPGDFLILRVEDNGKGIPLNEQEKVFDPFFTTKDLGEGTGLGLSVVHGIVTAHGGIITLDSKPGKGTTFSVYLPKYQFLPENHEEKKNINILKGDASILIVDDEEILVKLEAKMLEPLGYRVVTQTSSLSALELFQSDPFAFDLVLLDRTMPKMTGIELAQKIQRIRNEIPIILCSGFSDQLTVEQCKELGIKEYINKPIVRMELAEVVHRILKEQGESK